MRNTPRDVTGGEKVWGGMIPGLGLMNYVLGLLAVPIEVFLRRDFGERYFTRMNFIGGLIILILWDLLAKLFALLDGFNPLMWLRNSRGASESGMGGVIKWYIILSICHFLYMWWKDIIGKPVHSFSAGRSWLRLFGRAIMWFLNLFLNFVVRIIFAITPRSDKSRLPSILPVLRNADSFTERFVEPFAVFLCFFFCFSIGQYTMAWWLFFSVLALNLYTGMRHEQERSVFLDFRDQMIDARFYQEYLAGDAPKGKNQQERMIEETAREVEKNPDVLPIIEAQNPSLAKAIERISPKLKAMANMDESSTEQSQTA